MPELSEQAIGWLSELRATFDSRKSDYDWAEIVGGYSSVAGAPVIGHMVIRFHPAGDERNALKVDYPHFTLFSCPTEKEQGWTVFEALTRQDRVTIHTSIPHLGFGNCNLDQPNHFGSHSYPFNEEWPVDTGLLNGTPDGRLRHELLASRNGPLYTGPQEAINELTRVPVGWRGFAPTVYLLMPDRRVRIRTPRVSSRGVAGVVERGPVASTGLVFRGYVSSVDSTVRARERLDAFPPPTRFEIDEPNGPFEFETSFFPNHFIVAVIEKGSDRVLDQREYESARFLLANDFTFEADESHIEDLIRGGESDSVEFKETFEGNDSWVRSVCAFSNGQGGVIFFGVADDASIVGLASPKSSDSVAQKIGATVEPFPIYKYELQEIQGKHIAYLDVASGGEKPYSCRGQGVFVRAQATTRQASRHELLALARPSTPGS